jgi:hypothetical protein
MKLRAKTCWTRFLKKKGRVEVLNGDLLEVDPDHLAKGLIKLGWCFQVGV